jgi:hypothetical protein
MAKAQPKEDVYQAETSHEGQGEGRGKEGR